MSIRIDAHQHFWRYDPAEHGWITDEMHAIRKDFLPADLEPILAANGFDGCVAVQATQTDQETEFLTGLARQHSFIKGIVGWADLQAEDIDERLAECKKQEIIKGFRHILQSEDPAFMQRPAFRRGLAALQNQGFTYDLLIYPKHLQAATDLAAQFPDLPFIIDHLAKPAIRNGELENWKTGMKRLSALPNVWCKLSGMVTEADWANWKHAHLFPYIHLAVEYFGVERLVFGSDWPVCLVAASYSEMMSPVDEYFSSFTADVRDKVFGENAQRFYHL